MTNKWSITLSFEIATFLIKSPLNFAKLQNFHDFVKRLSNISFHLFFPFDPMMWLLTVQVDQMLCHITGVINKN